MCDKTAAGQVHPANHLRPWTKDAGHRGPGTGIATAGRQVLGIRDAWPSARRRRARYQGHERPKGRSREQARE